MGSFAKNLTLLGAGALGFSQVKADNEKGSADAVQGGALALIGGIAAYVITRRFIK